MLHKLVSCLKCKYSSILVIVLFSARFVYAQVPVDRIDTTLHKNSTDTLQQVIPADTNTVNKQWYHSTVFKNTAIIVAGTGIWLATFAMVDEPVQRYLINHRSAVTDKNSFAVQPLGRQHYMMPLAGAAFATGLLIKAEELQKAGMLAAGSIMVSAGVTEVLKHQFHRHRPSTGRDNHFFDGPSLTNLNTSLPSSHTTTAFAMATAVASVYKYDHPIIPPIAYGIATMVGLSRINDNAHWATDVLAGALVGYLSAKGTLYMYDLVESKLKKRKQKLIISPQLGINLGGVSALLNF